ncbi:MAG: potassium channel protein [Chloroflexi bacterium]|nr:potassium channel protein [Chloroflexota bacterium]
MRKTLLNAGLTVVKPFRAVFNWIGRTARRSFLFKLVFSIILILIVCAFVIFYFEQDAGGGISSLGEAFWWMFTVISKPVTGSGAKPLTPAGRAFTIILIVIGLAIIPLVTAKIASYMVTQRLREERGLEKIRAKNHTIICGWNEHIDKILDGIAAKGEQKEVVLVNSLAADKMNELLLRYKAIKPKYVHGDFTSEAILELANIRQADVVMILTDTAQGDERGADERAILGTLAVKSLNAKAKVCVEVLDGKSSPHVRRAGANEVVVHGEYDPYLLANAALAEGVVLAVRQLLSYKEGNTIQQRAIPGEYVGKKFGELTGYFRDKQNAILIGLCCVSKRLGVEDVLSGDYSMIDEFIDRKFKEAGKEYLSSQFEIPQANINPGDGYIIKGNEAAIVIGK